MLHINHINFKEKANAGLLCLLFLFLVSSAFSQCCSGDCLNGYGSFINQQGDTYTGNFKDGFYNGYAKMVCFNGDVYTGFYVSNYKQGWGILNYTNGIRYEGEWNKDKMHGDGILYYPDGSRHIGQFRNNRQNGRGVFYAANDSIIADGFFEDGEYIPGGELKNAGTSYLETYKANRLIQEYNISEFPFISGFSQTYEILRSAKTDNFQSVRGDAVSENTRGQFRHEGKVKIPGAKNCYIMADAYLANYGEFSSLESVVKNFVEVYAQISAADKSFTVVNDISSLEPPCIKRYLFLKDEGNYYSQDWLYLSIYEWKKNQNYILELGCGFGAGKVMKVIPQKEKKDTLFARNLLLLLNDADNSFRNFTDNDSTLICMANMDSLTCYHLNIELPGLGKLRYFPLHTNESNKGVSGYTEVATEKEAKKLYHQLIAQVKNSLDESYVYTEAVDAGNFASEILFAAFSDIHNDHAPVVRINLGEGEEGNYQVLLTVQYDAFTIISRQLPYSW
ncbi:MAG: MORN repeat-containing protein [Bacteroidia bacterium]